jgi:hypothetical protein
LGLNNKWLKGREGGEGSSSKKVRKKCCNYLLGIIYKLLEGSPGDGKVVVRKKPKKKFKKKFKKSSKKSSKKGRIKVAEYCIMAKVRKKFEKKVQKKVQKKV